MTKIFWTPQESETLHKEMVRLLRANPLLRKEQVLTQAQQVLPDGRRRKMGNSTVYRYRNWVDLARKEAKEQPPTSPTQEPAAAPAAAPAPVDHLRAILDGFLEALADKIVERIELRAQDFGGGVQEAYMLRLKHDPQPIPEQRAERLKVLVVGLLNQQAQTIIRSFPNLEVTCLTTEEALKRDVLHRSYTILMTKFINHSVQDKYRKAPSLRLCNGGVSELSAMLKSIS